MGTVTQTAAILHVATIAIVRLIHIPAKSDALHYAYPTFLNQAFPALPRPSAALEKKPSTPRRRAKSAQADANLSCQAYLRLITLAPLLALWPLHVSGLYLTQGMLL